MDERQNRRGGANGTWCLGNNEPDGKPYVANWNGRSEGCSTQEEAHARVQQMRLEELDAELKRRWG